MGSLKQLLPLGNRPVIRHCLDTLIDSGCSDVVVVLGPRAEEIIRAMEGLPVTFAYNDNPESGMAESVRSGLALINSSSTGVLVCLSDHPLVSAGTLKCLMRSHGELPDAILVPTYLGRRGHPALFPFSVLGELSSSNTLREIVNRKPERLRFVDVADEGVILDMDTREDYEQILKKAIEQSPGN